MKIFEKKMKLNKDLTDNAKDFIQQELELIYIKLADNNIDIKEVIRKSFEKISNIVWDDCEDLYRRTNDEFHSGPFSQYTRTISVDSDDLKEVIRQVNEEEYGLIKKEE